MENDGEQTRTHITDSRARIRVESSEPTNAQTGEMFFNGLTNCLCYYNGSKYIATPFND